MTIAFVTGANRGLGRALTEELLERGTEQVEPDGRCRGIP
jgi:NAD(P)-dependent dehydrogenase (short-subunit alcohol dehydrogenase family)